MEESPIAEKLEDIQNKKVEQRKEKLKNWLKDPDNLLLAGVILFAIIIRLYYFNLTKDQAVWWDEGAYGSMAKNYISHIWSGTDVITGETHIRPPLFPFLWSILLRIGFGELVNRFILLLIPSILSVYLVYLIGKKLYNVKVGLVASFVFSVLWIHLFYTGRLLTHIPSLLFLFISIYFFIKSLHAEKVEYKSLAISLFFAAIVTLLRYPDGLIFIVYLLVLVIIRFNLIKDKKAWLYAIIGFSPIILFFVYNYLTQGNIFPALLSGDYAKPVSKAIALDVLNYVPVYLKTTFFIFFILGLLIAMFELFIGYDSIKKTKKLQSNLLLVLILSVFLSYFVFYIRGAEDRWLFAASISMCVLTAKGLNYVIDKASRYGKYLSLILIILILGFGAYQEIKFANAIIKEKVQTYYQLKQGFEWIKKNTPGDSVILLSGMEVYLMYYGERKYLTFPQNESDVDNIKADYLVVQAFSQQPAYINSYLQNSQDKLELVNAYFFDSEKKQPAFLVFRKIK